MTQNGDYRPGGKPLTGRKVLAIALCGFGAIIAANLALAVNAVRSFPGIEVANGYVASQSFEAERTAQDRLGWRTQAGYDGATLKVAIKDRSGATPMLADVAFRIGRPTTEAVDATPDLRWTGLAWAGDIALEEGLWRIDVAATGRDGSPFRQQLVIEVKG